MRYEYRVLPAPKTGLKDKGIKSTEDRFANALATTMNTMGAQGWEYQRTDTLPAQQREGLMGKATVFQNMMVFRRALPDIDAPLVPVVPVVQDDTPDPVATVEDTSEDTTDDVAEAEADQDQINAPDDIEDLTDDAISSGRRLNLNSERM